MVESEQWPTSWKLLSELKIEFLLKPLQKVCLEKLANKSDVFPVLPTGYGKSFIYRFAKLMLDDTMRDTRDFSIAIVISPLVLLMKDQVTNLQNFNVESVT